MELLGKGRHSLRGELGQCVRGRGLGRVRVLVFGALSALPADALPAEEVRLPTPGQGPRGGARRGQVRLGGLRRGPAGSRARVESGDAGDGGYKATARMSTEAH